MEQIEFGHLMIKPQDLQIGQVLAILNTEYGFTALETVYPNDKVIAAKVIEKGHYFGGYQHVVVSYYIPKFNRSIKVDLHLRRDLLLALKINTPTN